MTWVDLYLIAGAVWLCCELVICMFFPNLGANMFISKMAHSETIIIALVGIVVYWPFIVMAYSAWYLDIAIGPRLVPVARWLVRVSKAERWG